MRSHVKHSLRLTFLLVGTQVSVGGGCMELEDKHLVEASAGKQCRRFFQKKKVFQNCLSKAATPSTHKKGALGLKQR